MICYLKSRNIFFFPKKIYKVNIDTATYNNNDNNNYNNDNNNNVKVDYLEVENGRGGSRNEVSKINIGEPDEMVGYV